MKTIEQLKTKLHKLEDDMYNHLVEWLDIEDELCGETCNKYISTRISQAIELRLHQTDFDNNFKMFKLLTEIDENKNESSK